MSDQNSAARAARLLTLLQTSDVVWDALATVPYDFDLDRAEYAEDWEVALASGDPHVWLRQEAVGDHRERDGGQRADTLGRRAHLVGRVPR